MKNLKNAASAKRNHFGWSYIDLLIGITVVIIAFVGGAKVFQTMVHNRTLNREIAQINVLQNRTVEDLRRSSINAGFDTLGGLPANYFTRPNALDNTTNDHPYNITVTIDNMDTDKKRRYTITVTGPTKSIVESGFVTRQRGIVSGGSLRVTAVDINGSPVRNIKISAPAHGGGPAVVGYTALPSGQVTIDGVLAGMGATINIDSTLSGHFFSPTQGVNPAGFYKTTTVDIISGGTADLQVVVTPPSKYQVRVLDYNNDDPVENAQVQITCSNMVPAVDINRRQGFTNADGIAEFTVYSGKCWAFNAGTMHTNASVRYAGTASTNDFTSPRPTAEIDNIGYGQTIVRTIKTLPVGKAAGHVYQVTHSGNNLVVDANVPPSNSIHLMMNRVLSKGNDLARWPSPTPGLFGNSGVSQPWNFLSSVANEVQSFRNTGDCYTLQTGFTNNWCLGSDPGWVVMTPQTSGGNSTYEAFVTPTIINSNVTTTGNLVTYHAPFNAMNPTISYWAVPPLVPVMVKADSFPVALGNPGLAFIGHFASWREYWSPPTIQDGVIVESARQSNMRANGRIAYANQTTTVDYYLLKEDTLANLHGAIQLSGGATNSLNFARSRLMLRYGPESYGIVDRDSGNNVVYDEFDHRFDADTTPTSYNLYNLGNHDMNKLVPGPARVYFEGYTETMTNPTFYSKVRCIEKVYDDETNQIELVTRPDSACNMTNLGFRIRYRDADGHEDTPFNGQVNVSAGAFSTPLTNIPYKSTPYVGSTPENVTLNPGESQEQHITIAPAAEDYAYTFYGSASRNQSIGWLPSDFLSKTYVAESQTVYQMDPNSVALARKTYINVRGFVVDTAGRPVEGAQVVIRTSGSDTNFEYGVTAADACNGCTNLTPTFPLIPSPMKFQYNRSAWWKHTLDPNLRVVVLESSDYFRAESENFHLYYDHKGNTSSPLTEIQVNFILQAKPVSTPPPSGGEPIGM